MLNPAILTPDTGDTHSGGPGPALRRELRRRLLDLPYRAFLRVTVHLLHAQGYSAARPAGRDHWKGRNTAGGWDAEAEFHAGTLGTLRCVAQVKQFDDLVVALRQVDELVGAAVRASAQQAVLITLSSFSLPARKAAHSGGLAAPVRLIDGDELTGLLVESRIGVKRGRDGAWALDEDYFTEVRAFATKRGTAAQTAPSRVADGNGSRLRALSVTVRLDPPEDLPASGAWHWEADMNPDMDRKPEGGEGPQ